MSWAATANRLAATTARVLGNVVVIGAVTGKGILLMPREEVLGGMVVSIGYTLELPAATFGLIAENTSIIVDGVAYLAREDATPNGDGAVYVVPLEKVGIDTVMPPAPSDVTYIINGDLP
jgi:hypothetical protein